MSGIFGFDVVEKFSFVVNETDSVLSLKEISVVWIAMEMPVWSVSCWPVVSPDAGVCGDLEVITSGSIVGTAGVSVGSVVANSG